MMSGSLTLVAARSVRAEFSHQSRRTKCNGPLASNRSPWTTRRADDMRTPCCRLAACLPPPAARYMALAQTARRAPARGKRVRVDQDERATDRLRRLFQIRRDARGVTTAATVSEWLIMYSHFRGAQIGLIGTSETLPVQRNQ